MCCGWLPGCRYVVSSFLGVYAEYAAASQATFKCNSVYFFCGGFFHPFNKGKRDIFFWPCDSLWGRYWVCKSSVWAFISFLLWCFVVLTQWLLLSNNRSSIASATLPCQELSMPTRPSQILQQTTNTQSSLWEKKGSSAVCGVIKTDLMLGSLLRTGNGNMKANYFV